MIENLPNWIEILFLIATVATIVLFYYSNSKPKVLTGLIIVWSIIQSVLAFSGFYHNTESIPPRFVFVLVPSTLLIIYGMFAKGRDWVHQNRNTKISTFLHTIRIPMEFVLLYLFVYKMVPELMTFEGRNFDILAGITAPIMGMLYLKNKISKPILLLWNIVGLFLICFILVNGILSAPLPIQQFAFDQPNVGINYFPFILLPATVVPIVLYTHLTDIVKLRRDMKMEHKLK